MGKNKKKTAIICLCGAAALSVGGLAVYSAFGEAPKTAAAQHTAVIEKIDIKQSVTVSGTVKSSDSSELKSSAVNTKVKKINVKVGDRVRNGDVIAVLDDSDLQSQLETAEKQLQNIKARNDIELSSAKRMYDSAVAEKAEKSERSSQMLSAARENYDKAVIEKNEAADSYNDAVNTRIEMSDLLQQATEEAEAAAAAVDELKEAADNAKSEYKSLKAEYDLISADSSAAPEDIAAAKARCDAAAAVSAEADDALTDAKTVAKALADTADKYATGLSSAVLDEKETKAELSSAGRYVDQAKSEITSASYSKTDTDETYAGDVAAKADSLKAAGLSADDTLSEPQRQIEQLKRSIESCTVKADCDGVITAVNVKEGELYIGDTIAVIQDDSCFMVSAAADQYDIGKLKKDQPVEITINAISQDTMKGSLSFVAPTPNEPTYSADGTLSGSTDYAIEADFGSQPEGLRIGMTARLSIITGEKDGALAVPDNCIFTGADGSSYITVAGDDKEEKKINVERGISNDYYTEIISPEISENMKVIVPEEDNSGSGVFY